MSSQEIAQILLEKGAVKVSFDNPFRWASGIVSPLYCDNRLMISYPKERKQIVQAFVAQIEKMGQDFDVLAGTASAGIPWAAFVAYELNKPMIYIRKEAKEYGAKKRTEGVLKAGDKVLLIEDLVSTGGSSISAAEALQEEGANVIAVLAIVSWEMIMSQTRFEEAGLRLSVLTSYNDIISTALKRGDITEEQYHKIIEFKQDPAGWAESAGL
ncbi:MAG: orotate phosphoribosyltransferase [Candidatus Gracilibacteria bacterium]|nr:orotate phosphoribosyltransferase [Candidatus Gracilibacteria bacterium]